MKISASLYSGTNMPMHDLVLELDRYKVDRFHIDCNDRMDVFEDIAEIRKISSTPIDLHIISENPEKYFDLIEKHKIEYVQFQFESLRNKINFPSEFSAKIGLSITSETPFEVFEDYANVCSFILFMTTVPGQSGGKFNKDNFQKIRQFRKKFPTHKIHVDGGVNGEVSFILRTIGVDSVVSGSFLVNHENIGSALLDLIHREVQSVFKVQDFMICGDDVPAISERKANPVSILDSIEKFAMGFVCIIDEEGRLTGISSNADIRRGFLKNKNDFNHSNTEDFINRNPIFLSEEATITEMLQLIKSKSYIISYLPVLNSSHKLTGVLTFNQLIRGE